MLLQRRLIKKIIFSAILTLKVILEFFYLLNKKIINLEKRSGD
jgi:hypothetical protein